jgi:uncharacterized protein
VKTLISRRAFLKGGALLGGALVLGSFVQEMRDLRVERLTVKIRDLAPEFNGFTICQVTDVHHSVLVSLDYINRVVETANSLNPDLTVLTGDYVDVSKEHIVPAIKALSALRAASGLLSILGNHDNFVGKYRSMDALASFNIPLLDNSHRIIERKKGSLCIAGVKDYSEDYPDASKALRGVDGDIPRILLSHHPDYAEKLPRGERVDLVLSGHTHGGQVRLPFGYAPVIRSNYGQRYSGGLVESASNKTPVYVSRGIGVVLLPMRINCPPELTVIRLQAP